jgi:methylisocitrate lyase
MQSAIDRACACVEAGADMVFPEAMTELEQYRKFVEAVEVPVLANITEFGATPLFTTQQLTEVGVSIALYPLSAFRAASKAALDVYEAIRREGSQQNVLEMMQTREELYDHLGYHEYEKKIDQLNASKQEDNES